MNATVIEVRSIRVACGPNYFPMNNCDGFWALTCKMEEGTFDEFKSFPNLVQCGGRTFGKSGWNSDNLTVCYTTAAASRYAEVQ